MPPAMVTQKNTRNSAVSSSSLPHPKSKSFENQPCRCWICENTWDRILPGRELAVDLDPPDQPKRRRIRRHKSKRNIKKPDDVIVRQTNLETQQEKADAPTMSKNKRRKLKAKLRLRRRREAGLASKASGVSFTYQPESSEEAEVDDDVGGEEEDDPERSVTDTTQEDTELAHSRVEGILSFLKSTQEIYFYDDTSRDDPAVCTEAAEELLHLLESGCMPPTDVLILDHMKTLLLLQDTERLKSALKMFPEHCVMPPDHARVISAFFNYWITQILPDKSSE
ncbi:glutamate-rich protein 1 isoform X2 [Grammomys surdaster]|uniref:glutamate-rich protein 1 isoform X2 n=1 Tax=Grammomys surdaster TaxID=491861 RepID=UPI0010A016A7|nr:glutamate-rich protein 1 isoform X2 [Grammomys surdaster]